jgi:hypothetical protein
MYVYQYKDETEIFYVGMGQGYRMWSHLKPSSYMPYDANYPSFYGKIKSMILSGNEPYVEKVFEGTKKECLDLEEKLIEKYKLISEGGTLYNISKGGGGRVKGKSYPMSENTRQRYRETRKQSRTYKIEKEDLFRMYIEENKTRKQIADYYNCSEVLVKQRLKEFEIRKHPKIMEN